MSEKFLHSCFVKVEDAYKRKELVEWLESGGIKPLSNHNDECCYLVMMPQDCTWICMETESTIKYFEKNAYNCASNIELFKAISAINNEDDYMQLFTDGIKWFKCEYSNMRLLYYMGNYPLNNNFHKATPEELIQHFTK